jgi:hypothetical protein
MSGGFDPATGGYSNGGAYDAGGGPEWVYFQPMIAWQHGGQWQYSYGNLFATTAPFEKQNAEPSSWFLLINGQWVQGNLLPGDPALSGLSGPEFMSGGAVWPFAPIRSHPGHSQYWYTGRYWWGEIRHSQTNQLLFAGSSAWHQEDWQKITCN